MRYSLSGLLAGVIFSVLCLPAGAVKAPDLKGYLQREQMAWGYPPPEAYPRVVEAPRVDESALSADRVSMLGYLRDFSEVAYLLEHECFDEARKVLAGLPDRAAWPSALVLLESRLESEVAAREVFESRRAQARNEAAESARLEKAAMERLARARGLASSVLDRDRGNVDAWLAALETERLMGKHDAMLATYREARKHAPGHVEILNGLGARLRIKVNMTRDVAERDALVKELQGVYEDLVKAVPGHRSARFQEVLAILKSGSGDLKGAIEHYRNLVRFEPSNDQHYAQLSRYQKDSGDVEGALATIRQGFTRDPNSARLVGALGYVLRGPEAKRKEMEFMASLAAEYPGRDDIQMRYARVLIEQERVGDAIGVLRKSVDFHPENGETRKLLMQTCLTDALALTKLKKHAEAVGRVEDAALVAQAEDLPLLYNILLPLYRETGDVDKAVALLARQVKADPGNWRGQLQIVSRLYALWGRDKRFDSYLEAVERQHADSAEAVYETAIVRWELLDELDVAEKRLRRVIELDPDYVEAYNSLGYLFAERGENLDEALRLVNKALDLKPHAGHVLDSMGWIYFQKGDGEKAVEWLEKAVKQQPDVPEMEEHLGRAYLKVGRDREGLSYLRKALEAMSGRPGVERKEDFVSLRKLVDDLERKQAASGPAKEAAGR